MWFRLPLDPRNAPFPTKYYYSDGEGIELPSLREGDIGTVFPIQQARFYAPPGTKITIGIRNYKVNRNDNGVLVYGNPSELNSTIIIGTTGEYFWSMPTTESLKVFDMVQALETIHVDEESMKIIETINLNRGNTYSENDGSGFLIINLLSTKIVLE